MARPSKLFALLPAALFGLAACATYEEPPPQHQEPARTTTTAPPPRAIEPLPRADVPSTVPSALPGTVAYRPGYGIVESVMLVRTGPGTPSAAAGGSVAPVDRAAYQLGVRMEDGSVQTLVQDNRSFMVGDRVQLTSDGRVIRL